MTLRLSIAMSRAERDACYRLRYEVNVAAGKRGDFLCHDSQRVTDRLDQQATIHYVRERGRVVGTMRFVYGGDVVPAGYRDYFQLERLHDVKEAEIGFSSQLVIDPDYRRTMTLPMLLSGNYNSGRQSGARIDLIHCAPPLVAMFEALGYQCYRRGVAATDVGNEVPMILLADDSARLERLGSPFAQWSGHYAASNVRAAWFQERFPDFVDGVSPVLSSVPGFLERVTGMLCESGGVGIVGELFDIGPIERERRFKRAALIRCAGGDILASSDDAFSDLIVQISGASSLITTSETRPPRVVDFSGAAVIDRFLHEISDQNLSLRCNTDCDFLIVLARDLRKPEGHPAFSPEENPAPGQSGRSIEMN